MLAHHQRTRPDPVRPSYTRLIAFAAGSAATLLAVLVIGPLLGSDPAPAVPAIQVGREDPPRAPVQPAGERRKRRTGARRGDSGGGTAPAAPAPITSQGGSGPAPFKPTEAPPSKPEPAAKPPPAAPPVPVGDDDEDDDDEDDSDSGDDG